MKWNSSYLGCSWIDLIIFLTKKIWLYYLASIRVQCNCFSHSSFFFSLRLALLFDKCRCHHCWNSTPQMLIFAEGSSCLNSTRGILSPFQKLQVLFIVTPWKTCIMPGFLEEASFPDLADELGPLSEEWLKYAMNESWISAYDSTAWISATVNAATILSFI